jgi:hypothetical protein
MWGGHNGEFSSEELEDRSSGPTPKEIRIQLNLIPHARIIDIYNIGVYAKKFAQFFFIRIMLLGQLTLL